jgi:hypothetical protein
VDYLALFLYHRGLANVASPIVLVVGLMGVVRYDYDWSKKLYEQYLCRKANSKRSEQEVQTPDC